MYVEEWTLGVVLSVDFFHAVCEKFYFEALAVLFCSGFVVALIFENIVLM
jgi:hypothetical protein